MTATIGKPYSKYKDYAESYHVAGTRPEDSQWRGLLASTLGYEGSINQFAYDLASEGKDSYGRQLRKYQKNSRPAICDLTLNAPKSLSVEALVHNNPVANAAHDRGVESAISFTEQQLLFSQVKRQGQVERVHTDKGLIGSFRQRDNREGEPHLHTHNVIFNVGWVEGKWRSLANEQVYLAKLTIGAIYQNDTAYHLHQAGYKTYWDANGQFELAGNPKRLLEETFAQRTEKLEAYLTLQGLDRTTATPEQLNAANRATRNKKAYDKDAVEQVRDWQATAASAGIVPCQSVSRQELEFLFQAASYPASPQEIVIAAAERLSENRSTFGYMELLKEGCRLSQGKYLSSEIQKAVEQSKELIPVISTTPYFSYTTRTILQRERQILDWAIQGKSLFTTIATKNKVAVAAQKFTLNSDQTKALQHIASSLDLITIIQGSAGVGKTRSLSALKDLMRECPLIGCAVGGLQAEALEAESGIQSQTLESLLRNKPEEFPRDALIVVDEAGVVSNRQMHRLIEQALDSNCRLLLVGDTKQLSAVEQGNPFRLLQKESGLETAFISQNMRQKDEQLLAVVDLCEAQKPKEAFDLLDSQGKICEVPSEEQLLEAISNDYLTRPPLQRRNTLIMVTTHKERATLTLAIRDRLIEQGELSGPGLEIEVLQKKDLDRHDLLLVDHYQVGDSVRFFRNSGQFDKGELYRVAATNPSQHNVELVDQKGQTYTLDVYRYKDREVFSPQRLEIRAGEEMRFTAGVKDHNGRRLQVNGQRFRVEAVDPQTQTIEISTKGKRLTLTPEDLRHSDYRWISTVHSLQGATAHYAIFAVGQGNGALLSRESWYVAASRAKVEFAVYCTDKAQLRQSIQASKAQRPALELIHPSISTPTLEPALQAIGDYVEQQAVESALMSPALLTLNEELNQLPAAIKADQQVDLAMAAYLKLDNQPIEQQVIEAISSYVEAQTLEASFLEQNLTNLLEQLSLLQNQEVSRAIQKLASVIKEAIVPQTTQQVDQEKVNAQAIEAISSYIEQVALGSAMTQPLADLTQQLAPQQALGSSSTEQLDTVISHWLQQLEAALTNLEEAWSRQATLAVSNYVEHEAIASTLVETVSSLIEQFSQKQQQLVEGKVAGKFLNQLLDQLATDRAISAIAGYVELEAVNNSKQVPALESLIGQLDSSQPHLTTALPQLEQAISNFLEYVANKHAPKRAEAAEAIADSNEQTAINEVITRTFPPLSPELLEAQFQILTDQILAPEAVYQEQGLRIERSQGKIVASFNSIEVDIHKPENLAILVNHLQALVNEFQLLSLYEEFIEAARLEKSITNQATQIVQLNQGNYHSLGLSVEIIANSIEIKLDQEFVFKSHLGLVERPDDLLQLSHLELQLQGTIKNLQQIIAAKLELEQARLLAERLQAQKESASKKAIETPEKGHGHGFAR
jgi:conjugative relaxase-like TrwC/TraI family protein